MLTVVNSLCAVGFLSILRTSLSDGKHGRVLGLPPGLWSEAKFEQLLRADTWLLVGIKRR